jgi:hypothetical protein
MHDRRRGISKTASGHDEVPAVVYLWALGLGFFAYVIGRVVLDGKPHLYHWLIAMFGGLLGALLGWLWYRWRGDVF